MGQGSRFFVSLTDMNLDRAHMRELTDLHREEDWRRKARFLDRVMVLIDRLPPMERDVIDLYFNKGKRQESIARIMGVSQQAVSHRLHVAYHRLAFLLDQPDIHPDQLREDLTELLPENSFGVEVLVSFAQTANQTETARRLNVSQQRVCTHLQTALKCLRDRLSIDALFYSAFFDRLLQHRSILCEVYREQPDRSSRARSRTRTATPPAENRCSAQG